MQFAIHRLVRLAEILAALGMPDDYAPAACLHEHGHGNFAGEGAFGFPVRILGRDGDGRSGGGIDGSGERSERRRNDDVAMMRVGRQGV